MSAATDLFEPMMLGLMLDPEAYASVKSILAKNNAKTGWISLHAADPTDTGAASPEISGGTYQRQQATFTISGSTATTSSAVKFSGMPAVTVGGVGLWSAQSGGDMLAHLSLSQPKSVTAGDNIEFPAANLTFSAD